MGICAYCKEQTEPVVINDGFYYAYGSESAFYDDYEEVSPCCGEQVLDGKCFLNKTTLHHAKADIIRRGEVYIKAGEQYRYTIKKGFLIDEGRRVGFIDIAKEKIVRRSSQKRSLIGKLPV